MKFTRRDMLRGAIFAGVALLIGAALNHAVRAAPLAEIKTRSPAYQASSGNMGEVMQYVSNPWAYQDLAIGRADHPVNTVVSLQSVVDDKPDVFALGQPVSDKIYTAWAVKKGTYDVRAVLDTFLLTQRKNGQMAALQKTWFGTTFDTMPEHYTITT